MPRTIDSVLMLVLALAVMASSAGCGSTDAPQTPPSALPSAQPSAQPSVSTGAEMRQVVRAKIDQMMADIDAAEKRGDVVDGTPVGQSSNPYDYVGISPAFRELVAFGAPALPAIVAEIEASKDDGLREYLLAAAGAQIDGDVPSGDGQSWDSGKEWARQYRAGQ